MWKWAHDMISRGPSVWHMQNDLILGVFIHDLGENPGKCPLLEILMSLIIGDSSNRQALFRFGAEISVRLSAGLNIEQLILLRVPFALLNASLINTSSLF